MPKSSKLAKTSATDVGKFPDTTREKKNQKSRKENVKKAAKK